MYLPSSFEETRAEVLHDLMREHPLATVITLQDAELTADHIPVQFVAGGTCGLLRGHIARANPLWRRHEPGTNALFVFQGAHAYISPSLYPSKQEGGEVVPTWNYAVVHAQGRIRFIHDAAWLLELVSRLTDTREAPLIEPWAVDDAPAPYVEKMLKAIVGFELTITALVGKWKVSQNRSAADRLGVVEGLSRASDPHSHQIAGWLAARGA